MILVISNRVVNENLADNESFNENLFGEHLAEDNTTKMAVAEFELVEDLDVFDEDGELNISGGTPKYAWTLKPIADNDRPGQYTKILNKISSGKLRKKWVVFVHGNNQTTLKNLEKCRKIEQLHDVNVITFSWPSWGKLFSKELLMEVGGKILKQGAITPGVLVSALGSGIKHKQKHYQTAVKNAIKSRIALHQTLEQIQQNFINPARTTHDNFSCSLLVHSLGNRVFEKMIGDDNLDKLSGMFDNVVLHQADVNARGHKQWVKKISLGERIYITHNRKDAILHISDIFGKNSKRLGHKAGSNKCSADQVAAYIDFTKGFRVGLTHGLFLIRDMYSEKTNDCFNALLAGESLFVQGRLPIGFVQKNTNTFSMKKENFIVEEEGYWDF